MEISFFLSKEDPESVDVEIRMPNVKSAKKRMELSREANRRNRSKRSRIRSAIKKVRQAEDAEEGRMALREAAALLDRAATKRLMHPNQTARIKSRLAKQVNAL